ncbi:probable ATP-dependent RNA helicase DDX49 [Coccinella septempunctata]|uniref:probable ATP-dependent RNA helicase DDX49 n=1 Tax=Coccinella septempunctata TaxID=41139 RepID=UPI001D08D855|nr:probable ATP-dependent RNA helicase DDX49 [Coccinella septempunctata]
MGKKSFKELGLSTLIIKTLSMMGIQNPTDIQTNCIPAILNGNDCVGAAKTGSGKTLAFALPIIEKLYEDPFKIFALILTPTRELAYQISDQFSIFSANNVLNLKHITIVGGMDMITQAQQIANSHIVVATPGRLADLIETCMTFNFHCLKFLVLDEADRLLGGQFDGQIKTIFSVLPKTRQNLFFSATITDTLATIKNFTKNETLMYEAPAEIATVEDLEQYYVLCSNYVKDAYLVQTVRSFREKDEKGNIMIFTSTCRNCQILSMMLNDVGFENVALHGMMKQKMRLAALVKFKLNSIKILIATDVASRGLDIPTVQLVINHTLPKECKEYIHRVGRTARAGRKGKAITLVTPNDLPQLLEIEKHINTKLEEYKVNDKEVGIIFTQISVSKSEAHINLDENNFDERRRINLRKKWILEGLDPDEEEAKLLKKKKKNVKKLNTKHKINKRKESELGNKNDQK